MYDLQKSVLGVCNANEGKKSAAKYGHAAARLPFRHITKTKFCSEHIFATAWCLSIFVDHTMHNTTIDICCAAVEDDM